MIIDGKKYSWESLEMTIDGKAFDGFTSAEIASVNETAPVLISITLPERLRGLPVELRHRYEGDAAT